MTNPNNDIPPEEITAEETPAEIQQPEVRAVVEVPPIDNRRRMRELLSVPERDRTDEQWDELIELEIQMAPGNRISGSGEPMGGQPRQQPRQQTRQQPRQQRPQQRPQRSSGGQPHSEAAPFSPPASDANASGPQEKKHRPRTKTNRRPRQGGKPDGDGGGTPA